MADKKFLDEDGLKYFMGIVKKKLDGCIKYGGEIDNRSKTNYFLSEGWFESKELQPYIVKDESGHSHINEPNVIITLLFDNHIGNANPGFYVKKNDCFIDINENYNISVLNINNILYYKFTLGAQLISYKADDGNYKWKVYKA